jgi:hypothetical protein
LQGELAACERYAQKSYNASVALGSVSDPGAILFDNIGGGTRIGVQFRTRMRATPTVTFYNPVTGASGSCRNTSTSTNVSTAAAIVPGEIGFGFDSGVISSGSIGYVHYFAESEL